MSIQIKDVLISAEELDERIQQLAEKLEEDFKDKDPLFIAVLNGSFMFCSDLVKHFTTPIDLQFIKAASYYDGTTSGGEVAISGLDIDVKDRNVVVIEDIIDSGNTMKKLVSSLEELGAKSTTIVSLLDKPSRREVEIEPDYVGFEIGNEFVVGYGLDYAQQGRNLPYIGILDLEDS